MHFSIGVQKFESFIGEMQNGQEVIDLGRLPSAFINETQSSIFALLRDREENVIDLYLYLPSLEPGRYLLADTVFGSPSSLAYFTVKSDGKRRTYRSSPRAPAVIEISEFDTTHKIVRGKFTMQAELAGKHSRGNWPKTLSITDGVFKMGVSRAWDDNPFRR